MSSTKPTLGNFLGRSSLDDQVLLVSDFIFKHILQENVEIECRLGLMVTNERDKITKRFHAPGLLATAPFQTEAVECKFLSEVDVHIFAHCNKQLNERLKDTNAQSMTYRHKVEEDRFYARSHGQVQRVTVDPETGQMLHSINKRKIATLDFHNPHPHSLDFRIMASTENKESIDTTNGTCTMIRKKDRISYAFDIWSIDLTKVHTWNKVTDDGTGVGLPTTTYEIELELMNVDFVRAECIKARDKKDNLMLKIAASLLDNLRTLSKFAFPSAAQRTQQQQQQSANKRPNSSSTSTPSAGTSTSASTSTSTSRPVTAHPWSDGSDGHEEHENGHDSKRHKTEHTTKLNTHA